MDGSTQKKEIRRYDARLIDGPLAGTDVRIPGDPDGNPIDVLPVEGDRHGAYVLAGFASLRGVLPYRWVTKKDWAGLRRWLRLGRGSS